MFRYCQMDSDRHNLCSVPPCVCTQLCNVPPMIKAPIYFWGRLGCFPMVIIEPCGITDYPKKRN